MSRLRLLVCPAVLWFVAAVQAQGIQTGCSPEQLNNIMQPSDPAYADAMELAATLQKRSFTIQCVLPSKFAQFLPRQTGAALFRTTTGDFEALFRPKGQTFDDVFISASPWTNGKGYRYTLRDPQGREVRRMDGRETIFVWDHNILFLAWDENTATAIMLGNTVRTQAASR